MSIDNKEILVGIDFGTTNTVITHFNNNKANILLDGIFKIIPSKIAKFNDKLYCGNYIPVNAFDIIHSFKISIGNNTIFKFNSDDNHSYSHHDLLLIFFKHLSEIIHKNLKDSNLLIKAVITVPSNFNDNQREIIRSAYEAVGIKVIRIINEPSAAALAYGLSHSSGELEEILVIDTGGGTMDFTILQKLETFFEVIHSEGLNDLGGNNFTKLIADDILRVNNLNQIKINENVLWNQAQKIKEKLTYLDNYEININNLIEKKINYNLTKTKFENLSNDLIKKVENILENIFELHKNINWVILVGGTSRIPILQKTIKEITNKNPWIHPNLESVVSEGAGLYAGIIENKYQANEGVVLMDVLPLSLGIELADGSYSIIIPKNTPLPVKRGQKYTTDSPGDTSIKVKVYQGERMIANKNFLIGEFIFDKVSAGGVPIIEIAFKVDLNSIINIIIVDRKSGVEKSILIKDIPQINSDDIDKIIQQANNLADTDEADLIRNQNIYLIKTHIENSLINLQINDLINENDKNEMLNKFKQIEESLETMNNFQLIETLNSLQESYALFGSVIPDYEEQSDDKMDGIEKLFYNDRKIELKNRIGILLAKNPEWKDFLNPVLEELTYENITIDYINEKLSLLEQLEEDNENVDNRDYKQELNNLSMYLKSEIESGNIDLGDKNMILFELINNTIILLNENSININWKEQLDILNKKCEEIYNL
jgi:molecular chaperone DnaK